MGEGYISLQIDEIYSKSSPPFKRMLEIVSESDLSYCVPIEELEPIPLTEEMLKVNGFEDFYESCYRKEYDLWLCDGKHCVAYKFSKKTSANNILRIYIDGNVNVATHILYVHELQHALRLCGLNEFSDNFKVTP